jgi:hypothetical protein
VETGIRRDVVHRVGRPAVGIVGSDNPEVVWFAGRDAFKNGLVIGGIELGFHGMMVACGVLCCSGSPVTSEARMTSFTSS